MRVFVDTSCWFASVNPGDVDHPRAKKLLRANPSRVTTDHVVVETWRLLHQKLGWQIAEGYWHVIRAGVAEVEQVSPVDFETAWAIGKAFADQEFSLTDRTSFAMMERLGIRQAASFDSDFAVYRFGKNRREAFEILA